MSDIEIRLAIAKTIPGWKQVCLGFVEKDGSFTPHWNGRPFWTYSKTEICCPVPDYPNDLSAIHDAVQELRFPNSQTLWKINQNHLEDIVARELNISKDSVSFQWEVQNATARQRAKALLRARGLWKE